METDQRRIALIARQPGLPERSWDESNSGGNRLIFVDSLAFLPFALDRGINELGYDVERLIIDRTGTALQFLELLSSLPEEFLGDVLFVRGDGAGFLSSGSRGSGRVLYTLKSRDIDFYLVTHSLLSTRLTNALPAAACAAIA